MKRSIKIVGSSIVIASLILSCSTRSVNIKKYKIGKVQTVSVGETMLLNGQDLEEDMRFIPAIDIDKRFSNEKLYLPKKAPYEGIYDQDKKAYMVILDKNELFSVFVNKQGVTIESNEFFRKNEKIFDAKPIYRALSKSKLYELVYSGKYAKYISLIFKEYFVDIDDIQRPIEELHPSYSEKVFYDINENDKIVYKNYVLKIIEATPNYLEYEILDDNY